jgi:hypothetical protein
MSDYQAFLLRLQRNEQRQHWRATLENVHTGETHHFNTTQELMAFLSKVTDSSLYIKPPQIPSQINEDHTKI